MASLASLTEMFGYPFYLYDESVLAEQCRRLRGALPDFTLLYSIKTNPHVDICRYLKEQGLGADAASASEVQQALAVGFKPDKILYSAPGKSDDALRFALDSCFVIADSYHELERLNALACGMERVVPVGLRINPDMSFGPGPWPELLPGAPAKFGVDEESLDDRAPFFANLRSLRLCGIHVFLRSQVLSHAVLAEYCRRVFALARKCAALFGQELEFINFGGGFGIACGEWTEPLDLAALGADLKALVAGERQAFAPGLQLFAESGRFLAGPAGTFITRVEDIKKSRGTTFVITPGVLNGFLRPALMNLLGSLPYAPPGTVPGPLEPLFSNTGAHRIFLPELSETERLVRPLEKVTVTGNLCTSLDVLARDVLLPRPMLGDILAVDNAGAYASTLSPFAFAGFERPLELYRDAQGVVGM